MPKRGRRNKGGRPRVEGEERYTNGDMTKAAKERRRKQREKEAIRDNLSVGIEQRKKHLGLPEELAGNQGAPVVAWRWFKQGVIQESHYRASEAFCRLHSDYLKAIRAPGQPRVSGGSLDLDPDGADPDYADWCDRKRAEWIAVRRALLMMNGLQYMAAQAISLDNAEMHHLAGDFREAMNIVHRLLLQG